MNDNSLDNLEIRAAQQRAQVHGTIDELKGKVEEARAKMGLKTNVRAHLLGASVAVTAVGFLAGFSLTGIFTRR